MATTPADEQLSFRPLREPDLPLLHAWLSEPHVVEWWGAPPETLAETQAKYLARVEREHHQTPWIMEVDGSPAGWIQWYRVADEAEWFPGVEVPPGTVAVDMAIGEAALLHRGLGRRLLLEFVHHVVRSAAPEAPEVWIDPSPRNEVAIRCYQAAGFVDAGIDLPDPERPGEVRRLMRLRWAGPAFR
jgi:RimJ/RimL family protein N-acetyltransferase